MMNFNYTGHKMRKYAISKMNRYAFIISLFPALIPGCLPSDCVPYQPMPGLERQLFNIAKRNITPDDVQKSPDTYTKTLVVWTGIIKHIDVNEEKEGHTFYITVGHHYFDWIEDRGVQREMFFLSPRGEGDFIVAWSAVTAQDYQFIRQFSVGDMIIAYGCPNTIGDNIIGLNPTVNIRYIKPQWFSTEKLDYGRSGESTE